MMAFFHAFLYEPIYNLLVFFTGIIPGGDVGIAVIAVTIVVRIIIMPFSLSAIRTQRAMKKLEPGLRDLRERFKDDRERQAKEMFALYRTNNVHPFASFLALFIQLPILIGLYWVFRTETLPAIDSETLYSFISAPETASALFLGLISITGSSVVLAAIAAITQFFQARLAIPAPPPLSGAKLSMQEEIGRAMALQARFVLPLIIGMVAYASGAIALYFITSNIISIIQELVVGKAEDLTKSKR